MKPSFLSVRARLTLWYAGALALIICVFSASILLLVQGRLYSTLDEQLGRELAAIDRVYREEPGELRDLAREWGLGLFRVDEGGTVFYQTEAWERQGLQKALGFHGIGAPRSWTAPDGRHYRVREISDSSHHVAAAIDEDSMRNTLWTLVIMLAAAAPFAVGLAIAGGYFLAGRMLAPVGAMADKAQEITADSLAKRLPVSNPRDEFGRLATVINDTFSRLENAFERLRRFTADASHELRTPLTVLRSVAEDVALQGSLDPDACLDVIGSMLEEVDRLTRLVDSLLTLTRTESGRLVPTNETVDLKALAQSVTEQLRVLAEDKHQNLALEAPEPIRVTGDATLLRQGLTNLVHNAIRYTPAGGTIRVAVKKSALGAVAIEVQDSGPGISAEHREHVFERFYRIDAGRSREDGGVGLGLAIARGAIEANGGRIELEGGAGGGSLFRIVLS
jgi:heavy metal sensor kinase